MKELPRRVAPRETERKGMTLDDLADQRCWVAWHIEVRDGRSAKIPIDPNTGRRAEIPTNPGTWGTQKEAKHRWKRIANGEDGGIGIVLGGLNDGTALLGIDLDGCFDSKSRCIEPWAKEVLDRLNTYAEVSPSGKGIKLFFRSRDHEAIVELMHGKKRRAFTTGEHCEIALDRARYYAVTEDRLDDYPATLSAVPIEDVRWLLEEAGPGFLDFHRTGTAPNRVRRDDSGSGHAFRFLLERKELGDTFEQARSALLADQGKAAEWARRKDDRDYRMAWDKAVVLPSKHSWEAPDKSLLDGRRGKLPEFPLDAIASVELQECLSKAAHGAGARIDHVAVPMLGIASGLLGTGRRVRASRSWSQPMALWTGVVGYSGDGKTPGMACSLGALDEVDAQRQEEVAKDRRQHQLKVERAQAINKKWKADCDKAFKDNKEPPDKPADADEPPPFLESKLYVTDITIERMAMLLQSRPTGMLLVMDELTGFLKNMHRYSEGDDRQFWLMGWDGNAYSVERINRAPIKLRHLLVSIVGGMQPDRFAECFKGARDGMYARFLWAWPDKAPLRPLTDEIDEIDPKIQAMFARLADLPSFDNRERKYLALSPQARAAFEEVRTEVHNDLLPSLSGREREWMAKAEQHMLRLSGVLAMVDWALTQKPEPTKILCKYVKHAERLVLDYFWPHSRACLRQVGLTDRHADARLALSYIKTHGLDVVSREQIRRDALSQRLDADQTEALLEHLCRAGWLRRLPGHTGERGRPAIRYEVNPRLHGSRVGK
jgi:hypothetical protein